jgi:hypothetical protein
MRQSSKVGGGTALLKAKPKRRASKAVRCLHLSRVKGFHDFARRIMRRGVRSFRALEIYVEDGALRALEPGTFDFVLVDLESLGPIAGMDLEKWREPVRRLVKTQFILMGPLSPKVKLKFFQADNIWFLEKDLPAEVVASLVRCLREG